MVVVVMGVAGAGKTTVGSLLAGQLGTLEAPRNALTVDVDTPPATIVERIRAGLDPGR